MKNSYTYDTFMSDASMPGGSHWDLSRAVSVLYGYAADGIKMILIPVPGYEATDVPQQRTLPDGVLASESVVSVRQMVDRIQGVLALTAAQVAQCVGVSRPALYKHLNGEPVRDMGAYQRVYRIAVMVENEIGTLDKRHKSILVSGKTLSRHLADKNTGSRKFLDMVKQVHYRVLSMPSAPDTKETTVSEQRLITRSVTRAG
jgi:hypothetical protein